jgi:V/A-type H+-transporting ATPase subunit I
MIVKMSKYAFMVYHREYDAFLHRLRGMGAVHVKESTPADEQPCIRHLSEERKRLREQLQLLRKLQEEEKAADKAGKFTLAPARRVMLAEGTALSDRIERLTAQIGEQLTVRQAVEKDMAAMSVWGEFDFDTIDRLREDGYEVTFFTCPASRYDASWEETYHAIPVNQVQSTVCFITVTRRDTPIEIDAERAKLPDRSLSRLRARLAEVMEHADALNRELAGIAVDDYRTLEAFDRLLADEYALEHVRMQTGREADDMLMLLEGWIPAAMEKEMEQALEQDGYYCRKLEVTADDDVPILFRNDFFSRLFEPISRLYLLPKYGELDLTPFFAPFFMIFFGLCLGDSGYGLFLLAAATAAKAVGGKKWQPATKAMLSLVQVLGTSTLFCGLLTGTFFGANLYGWGIPALDVLKEKIYMDNNRMFMLALILGVIQIVFGMCLKAANRIIQFGFVHGLSTIGWIVLLLGIGGAYLFPAVMPMAGAVHLAVTGLAGVLILFLNSPGKNVLLNVGLGLWDAYNMATGLLGDVLSYVRLFALGLSGGILAGVFNSLATGMSPDNAVLGPVVMVLIFVVGHSINLFMNVLGAIVHPMRLTFVEFFKNAGYEGGGKAYHPFTKSFIN